MYTLVKFQIIKRIRFSIGIITILILFNILFLGIFDLNGSAGDPYEGYFGANMLLLSIIFILHILSIKKDFYDERGKIIFSFSLKGHAIVFSKLILLIIDITVITIMNLCTSFLLRLIISHNFEDSIDFSNHAFKEVLHNFIPAILALIFIFSLIYFAIALSETIFYQNRIVGLISSVVILALSLLLIEGASYIFNLIIPLKLPVATMNEGNLIIIIPIIEKFCYNITNILLLFIFVLLSLTGTIRIIDRHLNL